MYTFLWYVQNIFIPSYRALIFMKKDIYWNAYVVNYIFVYTLNINIFYWMRWTSFFIFRFFQIMGKLVLSFWLSKHIFASAMVAWQPQQICFTNNKCLVEQCN